MQSQPQKKCHIFLKFSPSKKTSGKIKNILSSVPCKISASPSSSRYICTHQGEQRVSSAKCACVLKLRINIQESPPQHGEQWQRASTSGFLFWHLAAPPNTKSHARSNVWNLLGVYRAAKLNKPACVVVAGVICVRLKGAGPHKSCMCAPTRKLLIYVSPNKWGLLIKWMAQK